MQNHNLCCLKETRGAQRIFGALRIALAHAMRDRDCQNVGREASPKRGQILKRARQLFCAADAEGCFEIGRVKSNGAVVPRPRSPSYFAIARFWRICFTQEIA
jgi:hypothetical protein